MLFLKKRFYIRSNDMFAETLRQKDKEGKPGIARFIPHIAHGWKGVASLDLRLLQAQEKCPPFSLLIAESGTDLDAPEESEILSLARKLNPNCSVVYPVK
jgi:hypothetical protein